jgi:hypothetical protein
MTTEALDTLPAGTLIYIPNEWAVDTWQFVAPVAGSIYYTLLHPPDDDGVIHNKRPVYMNAVDLKFATINPIDAWQNVQDGLIDRALFVAKMIASFKPIQKEP